MEDNNHDILCLVVFIISSAIILSLTGCTLSFTNVSSVGRATDMVDENQTASADVPISVPIAP